ncbi:MAG TPA: FkbM family methyltransferase [Pirellulales bacterium]|nr:FkbM family methyltransferase [Pirellulales bacterium]
MRAFRLLDAPLRYVERCLWGNRQNRPTVSYAQNGEDVLLNRALKGQSDGFYIDVGANDPVAGSVTKLFYDRGFRGINIEPGGVFDKLARARPRDINLRLALSDREGERTFYEFPECDGLSTLSAQVRAGQNRRCVERTAAVATLADVCEKYVRGAVDFLKIDVEGHEREVIAGANWRRWRPRIVLVESPTTAEGDGPHREWEPRLLGADYLYGGSDGINRYYVRREDERLLACFRQPLNVLDDYVAYHHVHRYQNLGPLAISAAQCLQKVIDFAGFWYPRQLTHKGGPRASLRLRKNPQHGAFNQLRRAD